MKGISTITMLYGVQDNVTGLCYTVWQPAIFRPGVGAIPTPIARSLPEPEDDPEPPWDD